MLVDDARGDAPEKAPSSVWFARTTGTLVSALMMATSIACSGTSDLFGAAAGGAGGTGGEGGGVVTPKPVDKVDLLLTIDNSRNMGDKHRLLAAAVPDLVGGFANPPCVDDAGAWIGQASSGMCPGGGTQLFPAIDDIHIGVVSTSLGGRGADACSDPMVEMENDHAHLLNRDGMGGTVATYQNLRFLAWDPMAQLDPPGENDIGVLEQGLAALVSGAGQEGCGYEATLESWYRFLIDPRPYERIVRTGSTADLQDTDQVLLDQRRDFLRPDSMVVVLVLSDENDCSVRDGGQYFYAMQLGGSGGGIYHLPPARAACATDPNDPCCRSCGQPAGDGCDASQDMCTGALSNTEDAINLRCFDQKARFGIDFLWPLDRYTTGLTSPEVQDSDGNVVKNPLYAELDAANDDKPIRETSLVFLGAIIGVPWQDIARRNVGDEPDLLRGVDGNGNPRGGIQSAAELSALGTWDLILGDPASYHTNAASLPSDALMHEGPLARSGVHPLTGDPVAPAGAAYGANPINGHEYSIPEVNDLQYACVFDLETPRDCTDPVNLTACECQPGTDSPVCQNPVNDQFGTIQYRAKAYPGIRHLSLLESMGAQGIVGTICPADVLNLDEADYGYRPSVRAVVDAAGVRIRERLEQ